MYVGVVWVKKGGWAELEVVCSKKSKTFCFWHRFRRIKCVWFNKQFSVVDVSVHYLIDLSWKHRNRSKWYFWHLHTKTMSAQFSSWRAICMRQWDFVPWWQGFLCQRWSVERLGSQSNLKLVFCHAAMMLVLVDVSCHTPTTTPPSLKQEQQLWRHPKKLGLRCFHLGKNTQNRTLPLLCDKTAMFRSVSQIALIWSFPHGVAFLAGIPL